VTALAILLAARDKDAEGRKTTPAMKAGLTDHPWTLLELLQAASTH
jgi:hypothetical protein